MNTDRRKYQSSASLALVWGIHQWPVNSPHKGPVTRKMFPFDDVIMIAADKMIPYCCQHRKMLNTLRFIFIIRTAYIALLKANRHHPQGEDLSAACCHTVTRTWLVWLETGFKHQPLLKVGLWEACHFSSVVLKKHRNGLSILYQFRTRTWNTMSMT